MDTFFWVFLLSFEPIEIWILKILRVTYVNKISYIKMFKTETFSMFINLWQAMYWNGTQQVVKTGLNMFSTTASHLPHFFPVLIRNLGATRRGKGGEAGWPKLRHGWWEQWESCLNWRFKSIKSPWSQLEIFRNFDSGRTGGVARGSQPNFAAVPLWKIISRTYM